MVPQTIAAAALLGLTSPAMAGDSCQVEIGPSERFAQGQDVVVGPGERLTHVTALRGRVVVRGGAEVDEVMALGGDVVLEAGARVNGSVLSVGGKVAIQGNAWVAQNVVSLGGEVARAPESWVGGNMIALAVQVGDQTLGQTISQKLGDLARCKVVQVRVRAPGRDGEVGAGKML